MTPTVSHPSPPDQRPLERRHFQPLPRSLARQLYTARHFSYAEARAFLGAIPKDTLQGKRDYALFLIYLETGRRKSEIRLLRFGSFEEHSGKMWFRLDGKRNSRRDEFPLCAWEAIRLYLQAAGRLPGIKAQDYIFTPLNNNAANLPNMRFAKWQPNRPLSMREIDHLLKKYARHAGLDADRVNLHTLRYTYAMLLRDSGGDVDGLLRQLGSSSFASSHDGQHRLKGPKGS